MCRAALLLALILLISSTVFAGKRFDEKSPHAWMNGYTLILVDAESKEELASTRDFITAQGGRIAVVLTGGNVTLESLTPSHHICAVRQNER